MQGVRASRPVLLHLSELGEHYARVVQLWIFFKYGPWGLGHPERRLLDDPRISLIGFHDAWEALLHVAFCTSGRVGDRFVGGPGVEQHEGADVSALVDDESVFGAGRHGHVEFGFDVGYSPA